MTAALNAHALDITGREIDVLTGAEYTRGFGWEGELSVAGAVRLGGQYALKGGLSAGRAEGVTEIRAFAAASAGLFTNAPVFVELSYKYGVLVEYEAGAHSILPVISYSGRRAGVSAGVNFRFTSFFAGEPQFESILSFNAYFNFINRETLLVAISCGNFGDFYGGNMGAYSLKLNTAVRVNARWRITNEIELLQSGGDGLSTVFYGFAFRGGAKVSW